MKRVLLIGSTEFQGGIESFIKRLVTQLHESYSFSILQFRDAQIVDFSYFTETLNVPVYKVLIPGGALGILQRERIANRFLKTISLILFILIQIHLALIFGPRQH
ncbi:hypothetical protein [Lactiplantibacillus carotarum]|uniref:hypothetical protein n=1 Tax=Lactiplantibacillus carotarum TaxID=2993456 RepID=UPI00298F038F|nr:hypothetical protein [Lactiplantibacillus carotarum]